jgi:hypothetical protein
MPSTYSTSLGLELIGNGEQAGTWGTTTNNNLGTLLEQAITGVEPITLTGGDYTLTDYNGLPDQARNAVLVLGGLLGAPCNVIAPAVEKTYIVRNFSNAAVTIKTASGNGVTLTNAASAIVFCDGTNFYSATTLNYIDGNLTVTGNTALQNNVTMATNSGATVTVGGDVILQSNNVYGNVSKGQWFLPTGNTSVRTNVPVHGLLRYNSELNIYEGYQNNTWVKFITVNELNYTVEYLVAAGGGGGGIGGGGAGGLLAGSTVLTSGATYTISVGAGGAGGAFGVNGVNGTNSGVGSILTSIGGGGGGSPGGGNSGGSGGGAHSYFNNPQSGGSGTAGQGNNGGSSSFANSGGAGGGGAGAGGTSVGFYDGGSGGVGLQSTITGSSVYYSGGGGGGGAGGSDGAGAGGLGGGGGGTGAGGTPGPGQANTGGGGGGGNGGYYAGGSGVVILRIPTISYTGNYTGSPVINVIGGDTIMKFNSSGSYTA